MFCEDEHGDQDSPQVDECRGRMARNVKDIYQNRHGSGSSNRAERGEAPEDDHEEPKDDRSDDSLPANENEDAEASGDAFAASKLEPDREATATPRTHC